MGLPVVFRPRVKQDLRGAFEWYQEQRAGLGEDFLASVQAIFKTIGLHPELFAAVHGEIRRAILSRFPFAVFYLVESKRVVVLRILHTARNPELWPKPRRSR
jgi:plasmid stabilization system protein ParE